MRTDGVIVESLLGQASALDHYRLSKQREEIREKSLENEKLEIGLELVKVLMDNKMIPDAINAYRILFGNTDGFHELKKLLEFKENVVDKV